MRYAADVRGWDLAEFNAYRIRVPFPVIGSNTLIDYQNSRPGTNAV